MKKAKQKKRKKEAFNYITPVIVAIITILAIVIGSKYISKQAMGSIYNVNELETNFNNIEIGDEVNYEINGHNKWIVIGKDDYEGTLKVVSDTNVEDLTLEENSDISYHKNRFQEVADRYVGNDYVISARCVNKDDLSYFSYDTDFWLDTVENNYILTSKGSWNYKSRFPKIYVIPYVEIYPDDYSIYSIGDEYDYYEDQEEKWIVVDVNPYYRGSIYIIPKTPREIIINDLSDDIRLKASEITGGRVYNINMTILQEVYQDYFNQHPEKILLHTNSTFYYNSYTSIGINGSSYYAENGQLKYGNVGIIWQRPNQNTLGYRPVLTLKIPNATPKQEEISSDIEIGDYVKYEANGYKNWKALSVDKKSDTIEIISGAPVKNITLTGKDNYENYENILQNEVNSYLINTESNSARSVNYEDVHTLSKISDNVKSEYWINNKKNIVKDNMVNYEGSNLLTLNSYALGTMYYSYSDREILKKWIAISIRFSSNNDDVLTYYKQSGFYFDHKTTYEGDISYTAGLRPVITIELEDTRKLSEKEAKEVEDTTAKQEKVLMREQETKNNNYKGSRKVDDSSSSTGNNNEIKTDDKNKDNNTSNEEKIVYKDKPSTRYQLIIQYIIIIIQFGIIVYLILKRKK